jgi:hypothetical protein
VLLKLNITQEHINLGRKNCQEIADGTRCPIALALRDAGMQWPHVFDNDTMDGSQSVIEFKDENGWEHKLSEEDYWILKNWVDNFDEGNDVFPLSIEIEVD